MTKQKQGKPQARQEMTGLERLGLRVSAMINSPKAQLERRVHIHRLDTDEAEAWEAVMELLYETDGLELEFGDDGNVTVYWESEGEGGEPGPPPLRGVTTIEAEIPF